MGNGQSQRAGGRQHASQGRLPVPSGVNYAQVQHGNTNVQFQRYSPYNYGQNGQPSRVPRNENMPQFQHTSTLKNNVNLDRKSLKLHSIDSSNPNLLQLQFQVNATSEFLVEVHYLATEAVNASLITTGISSKYNGTIPEATTLAAGIRKKFKVQEDAILDRSMVSSQTDLTRPDENIGYYPMIIVLTAIVDEAETDARPHRQINYIALSDADGSLECKILRQKLEYGDVAYNLLDIYGIDAALGRPQAGELDDGKECVICMSMVRNTMVLPCRHLCMCSECASMLRNQSNKCPICRSTVESLMEINVTNEAQAPETAS